MSTDYYLICSTCSLKRYLGYRWGGIGFSFGYNRNDFDGRNKIGEFVVDHCPHGLIVVDCHDERLNSLVDHDDGSR
jgi:hypothetical protein